MKVYPFHLEELLQEESKKSLINYPFSILKIILRFQIAHQMSEGGHKLTREEVAVLMLEKGSRKVEELTASYHKKFTEVQKAKCLLLLDKKQNQIF